jgi:hypothetical protein
MAVSVGDVWSLRDSEKLGLVVFVRAESAERPEDLRVVPIYTDREAIRSATHRDLVIPSSLNTLERTLLVASWNARGLDSGFLGTRVGTVGFEVVEAARAAEMACIIPDMDIGAAAKWLGARPKSKAALARAVGFQESELDEWDALVAALSPREELGMWVYEQFSGVLKRNPYQSTEAAQAMVGVPITHSLEGNLRGFYGSPNVPVYPPGPPAATCTASRTAPTGAVLVSAGEPTAPFLASADA